MNELAKSNKELYEKYGLILYGLKRFYLVPLDKRVYDFDRCTPRKLFVDGSSFVGNTWLNVYKQFINSLYLTNILDVKYFYNFKVDWSKADIFSDKKTTTNCFKVADNLYASNNFSSIHYIWIIQDLLKYFKINISNCYLVTHCPSIGEPESVKNEYILLTKKQFSQFLIDKGYKEESVSNAIKSISFLNRFLIKMNCGSNDFFLIDDLTTYVSLKDRVLKFLKDNKIYTEEQLVKVNKILRLYKSFLILESNYRTKDPLISDLFLD